jgi:hypothetical protein
MRRWQGCFGTTVILACVACAQQPATQKPKDDTRPTRVSMQPDLKAILEAKVRAEWDAFKRRNKKAYGDLLAEDFVGVEEDQQGTRNKLKAANEIDSGNIYNYSLFGLSIVPVGSSAAFATYEVTMEFPPKAQVRYMRVYVSELWLNRGGQWKIRHSQETHVK